jgi:lysophospholipid acyltransferase (LPLAT)-like uncharacterized protein
MKLLKQKWVSYLLARVVKVSIKALLFTCRIQVSGMDHFVKAASNNKCILMLWHNRLTLVAEIMTRYAPQFKYAAVISNSRDAEILASYTNSFSVGRTIRVPHNARAKVLQTMVKQLKTGNEVIIITPDGPRGPAMKVKPGVAFAAKEASANIIPFSWNASSVWRFKTWDKLMLPKPFSTITVKLGEALKVQDEEKADHLEQALKNME